MFLLVHYMEWEMVLVDAEALYNILEKLMPCDREGFLISLENFEGGDLGKYSEFVFTKSDIIVSLIRPKQETSKNIRVTRISKREISGKVVISAKRKSFCEVLGK